MKKLAYFLTPILMLLMVSCQSSQDTLSIDFEKYTLANGLDVILHQDKSDPIVSVAIQYHVGSNREVVGKTGFAHLFEHMMFQQSENVGQDQFFKKIQGAGGTLNGGTGNDGTVYYEIVPKNALELALWLESDRMGYLINTVTQSAFSNQQDVVINEKRERVDNNPYGHNGWVIDKNLFPEGHPYNWQVIGEMEDLFDATIEDVKEFHGKWYVPNNATLALAGDFEIEEVKAMVDKYFGEIPSGNQVADMDPVPVTLDETKRLYHEDNFARTPLLRMTWPTIEQYHPDAYALNFLAELLGSGKKAAMYKVLVKEKQLTSRVSVYNRAMELSGKFNLSVPANADVSLADAEAAVFEAFAMFEEEGIKESDLERIKAGLETNFYSGISSVLGKGFQLASYNEYAGDPGFITQDIENIIAVTVEDVQRVYDTYIKGQHYVLTSFVPKGQMDLVAENCEKANVVEESLDDAYGSKEVVAEEEEIVKTPASFDRSVEPPFGPDPVLSVPEIWTSELSNGIKVTGIEHHEVPLINYAIEIKGGHYMDTPEKAGVANLVTDLMMEGTENRTPEELEEAIDMLGANINMYVGSESITVSVSTLKRNLDATIDLVEEILLEPRWDEEEFGLWKMKNINNIKRNSANPNYLAQQAFNNLLFGEGTLLALPSSGTVETVEAITIDDLKAYYETVFSPSISSLRVVGDINQKEAESAFAQLEDSWAPKEVDIPAIEVKKTAAESKIYLVDYPGAKQSVINIGNLYTPESHLDHYAATVMNYKLGGSFSGILNLILREEKGFTYGASSGFSRNNTYARFSAGSSVRSGATQESLEIFRDEMAKYRDGISDDDLAFTKDALLKSNALNYETLRALQGMLSEINRFGLDLDYVKKEEDVLRKMTLEQHHELAQKYLNPDEMIYVVVGDAETQMKPLSEVGLGEPVLVEVK
jgi:zinc protease